MNAITLEDISKTYLNGTCALKEINLSIKQGEVYGFLGPNGAGKTTAIGIMAGILAPTSGKCQVLGLDPVEKPDEIHKISGIVTEHAQMYDNLTGIENLVFYGTLFGMTQGESKARGVELLTKLNLKKAMDKKLKVYSTGMRQRLSLARAMIHKPKILLLDEPTSGLDPESTRQVNELIDTLAGEEGTTIFLCTHQLRYAQEICTSYGLISHGQLLVSGTLDQLRKIAFDGLSVTIKTNHFPPDLKVYNRNGLSGEIILESEWQIPDIVKQIVECGGKVYHVSSKKPSLEDIYFELTKQDNPHEQEVDL